VEGTRVEGGSEEVKGMKRGRVEKESERTEGTKGEKQRRRKNREVHNATFASSMDESRLGKGGHP